MRSFKNIFLLLLIIIPSTAYVDKDAKPGFGLSPGSVAPEIRCNGAEKGLLSSMRGKYLLLQFWATYDAQSRMSNLLLYNTVHRHWAGKVQTISMAFDAQKLIFEETVRTDGMDPSSQIFVTGGEDSDVFDTYDLSDGFTNYLIDKNGVIVAKNVTPDKLANLVK